MGFAIHWHESAPGVASMALLSVFGFQFTGILDHILVSHMFLIWFHILYPFSTHTSFWIFFPFIPISQRLTIPQHHSGPCHTLTWTSMDLHVFPTPSPPPTSLSSQVSDFKNWIHCKTHSQLISFKKDFSLSMQRYEFLYELNCKFYL